MLRKNVLSLPSTILAMFNKAKEDETKRGILMFLLLVRNQVK